MEPAPIILKINDVIFNPIIILLFALALLYFLWGVAQFILNMENESARTQGKHTMFWGVIGMLIMVGVWQIINIVEGTFGL